MNTVETMPAMNHSNPPLTRHPPGVRLRPATPADAEACGRVFWEAFADLARRHAFPTEPDSPEFTGEMAAMWLSHPGFAGLVAEGDDGLVGCAFVDERDPIRGIGPVCVAPAAQDAGVGRALMEALQARCRDQGAPGVRLVQTAYHYRSLALYAKLGYQVREPISVLAGQPPAVSLTAREVRPALAADLPACDDLCRAVHGHTRGGALRDAVAMGMAVLVESGGAVTGYATGLGYGFHAVGRQTEDLQALIGSCPRILGLGILIPSRDAALLGWCLEHGLRLVQQSTLMTLGAYREPSGAWLPSILY